MITFLSTPKPFVGAEADNQSRAIRSWLRAVPTGEVILFGLKEGADKPLAALGCRCVARVDTTSAGIPYFNGIVAYANAEARYEVQVYLNCDIILTESIARALRRVQIMSEYLVVGQRLDLAAGQVIDLNRSIVEQVRNSAQTKNIAVHPASGMDYFMFRRGLWRGLAPLIVARGAYDNALVAFCLRRGMPVIDATRTILAIHQFHTYDHVSGGKNKVFAGPEERQNRRLHDIMHGAPNIDDADFCLVGDKLVPKLDQGVLRRLETWVRFKRSWKLPSYGLRVARKILMRHSLCQPGGTELGALIGEHLAMACRSEPAAILA